MNFEFISYFESVSVRRLDFDWRLFTGVRSERTSVQHDQEFSHGPRLRGKLAVAFNWWRHQSSIADRGRRRIKSRLRLESLNFSFCSNRVEEERIWRRKFFKIFLNSRKIMRNHLWVIWWVILELNLLVSDWWWIMAMIRQLKLPNKTCRGQKLINKRKCIKNIFSEVYNPVLSKRFENLANPWWNFLLKFRRNLENIFKKKIWNFAR